MIVVNNSEKKLHEKMVDYRRFGILMLVVGAFFYLGVILPTETKVIKDLYLMMGTTTLFLSGSIFFFIKSREIQNKLTEIDQ